MPPQHPAPQPARFAAEAEEPFQAVPLHPQRGLRLVAGDEVECGADGGEHRGVRGGEPGGLVVLFGGAEAEPDDLGTARTDPVKLRLPFSVGRFAERRRLGGYDQGAREAGAQLGAQLFQYRGVEPRR